MWKNEQVIFRTVLPVRKQASTAYGVCEVWKQELSTLIAIISRSASSWFSANYTGRFLFGEFQEEAIASSCLLLATPMIQIHVYFTSLYYRTDARTEKYYISYTLIYSSKYNTNNAIQYTNAHNMQTLEI